MLAFTTDSLLKLAVGLAVANVVIGVLAAILIKNILAKLLVVALMAGLAIAVWTQRSSVQDCVDKMQAEGAAGKPLTGQKLTCTFFGIDVDVPVSAVTG